MSSAIGNKMTSAISEKKAETRASTAGFAEQLSAWLQRRGGGNQDRGGGPSRLDLTLLPFDQLVGAIELAGDKLFGDAEILLYQDWISANAGISPYLFAAWFNLGVALAKHGDRPNAVIAYQNALILKPDLYAAAVNLGLSLEALGRPEEGLHAWEKAIQPDHARTSLLNQKARLLETLGRLPEAEAALHASLATLRDQPDAMQHWAHIRQKTCCWPIFPAGLFGLDAIDLQARSGPLGMLAITDDIARQCDAASGWIARKTHPVSRLAVPKRGYRHPRVRVGYLSSDFCRHAMSFLIAELFELHDRSKFEIFGYCSSPDDGSDIRARVLAAFDHVRIVRAMSDEQAASLIRQDEIDILIDLNGLTAGARLQILRWKPAPIQATYLGYIGPVPIPELDYLFCDEFVIPATYAAEYRPAPLPIAGLYQANDSKRTISRPLSRLDFALPDDSFVLCCFSNHYKITAEMFAAWLRILQQAGNSVLWLSVDSVWSQMNLAREATRDGIDPSRLIFAERTDPATYMARLQLADLFLDTFPYNAGTIASDAIRMKLPLLTLKGRAFASRMASSLLNAIDAGQGIVESMEAYEAAAVRLATDPAYYASFKSCFTDNSWERSIGDIKRFTSEFETTLLRLVGQLENPGAGSLPPQQEG